jgi:phage baseplate assembly protein W
MSNPPPRRPNARGTTLPATAETYPAFLGCGWSFPPTFNRQTAAVAMVSADVDIRESLWILLSTNLGERIMLATYGCDLWSQVFTALTPTTANAIALMVTNAIIAWEPRVSVEAVTVTEDGLAGRLDISIDYMVRQTNTRSNLVYPFYTREPAIAAPPG